MGDIIELYEMIKELEERVTILESENQDDSEDEFDEQELEDETDPLTSDDEELCNKEDKLI